MRVKRRRLGQHLLRRVKPVAAWFRERVCGARLALEVGVGPCNIARYLVDCVAYLVGLDIEEGFLHECKLGVQGAGLEVVRADVLAYPLRLDRFEAVYGNIPYSITGELLPILVKFYQGPAYLMLQREVAQRLAASPGTSSYGRLTVLVNLVYEVRRGPVIPPQAFTPPPRVFSQLVELVPRRVCDIGFIECIERFTACLFAERRKQAEKVIRKCVGGELADELASIVSGKRVYELSVEEVEALAKGLGVCEGGCYPATRAPQGLQS